MDVERDKFPGAVEGIPSFRFKRVLAIKGYLDQRGWKEKEPWIMHGNFDSRIKRDIQSQAVKSDGKINYWEIHEKEWLYTTFLGQLLSYFSVIDTFWDQWKNFNL